MPRPTLVSGHRVGARGRRCPFLRCWRRLLFLGPFVTLGCASLDPTPDHDRLDALVQARSGRDPAWRSSERDAFDPTRALTQEQAVTLALQSSPEIQGGLAEIALARADVVEARLWPDPVFTLVFGLPTDGLPGDPHMASLMQQLDWLWTRGPRVAAADVELGRAISAVADQSLRVIAETRQLHARVTFGERSLRAVFEWVDATSAMREARAREVAAGTRPRADLRRAQAEEERALEMGIRRQREVEEARRALLSRMGAGDGPARFAVTESEAVPPLPTLVDEARVIARARAQRLDLAAAQARVNQSVERRNLAARNSWLDLGGMVGHERNHEGRKAVTVGAQVRPKLWGSGAVARARAKAEHARAVADAERLDLRVCQEVRSAWLRCQEQDELVARLTSGRLQLASEDLENAESQQLAGIGSGTDTLELVMREVAVRIEWIDAERERVERYHELVRAAGGSLADSDAPTATRHRPESGTPVDASKAIDRGAVGRPHSGPVGSLVEGAMQ